MSINFQQYARPYAKAAFEWAKETHQEQSWQNLLTGLADVFNDVGLRPLLFNPKLGAPRLADVLIEILGHQLDAHQQNFLKLVASEQRFDLIPTMAQLFHELRAAANHQVTAEVTSAWELSASDQQRLIEKLAAKYHKKVQLHCQLDPSLIGGLHIKVGDEVIDASLRGKLEKLATQLI